MISDADARGAVEPQGVLSDLVDSLDQSWNQLDRRLVGITNAEYVWEPSPGCWSVRDVGDGRTAAVDWIDSDPEPDPPPLTTIAWRMWHIAVDCLDSYSRRRFGSTGTGFDGTEWVLDVDQARTLMTQAWLGFRDPIAACSPGDLMQPLGPSWGAYARHSTLALALHAHREVTHHGAEIGLLRDLYRASPAG